MAEFKNALEKVLNNEGLYSNDPDDTVGGETAFGIARKIHSKWDGWVQIDMLKRQPGFPASINNSQEFQSLVEDFYRINFWNKAKGDDIASQAVAESIFDFAVNAGVATSSSLAQMVVGTDTDGVIGPNSLKAINAFNESHFLAAFTVAKIARYVTIVKKRPTSRKYFYGWVLRALGEEA